MATRDPIEHEARTWHQRYRDAVTKNPERRARFSTVSDHPIKELYTPLDIQGLDYTRDLGCLRGYRAP